MKFPMSSKITLFASISNMLLASLHKYHNSKMITYLRLRVLHSSLNQH